MAEVCAAETRKGATVSLTVPTAAITIVINPRLLVLASLERCATVRGDVVVTVQGALWLMGLGRCLGILQLLWLCQLLQLSRRSL